MNIFRTADILIPKGVDFSKWSVVACDQYTSQPEYWQEVSDYVGDAPSTLKITFPEAFLSEGDARIEKINATMAEYVSSGLFETLRDSFVYVKRTQRDGRTRNGLIGAIDLEAYDFSKGSDSLIRATEGTIIERIPPRVKIRRDAPLELPHILMLIDDREHTVIEPLEAAKDTFRKLYDFDLMQDSGHLTGYQVNRYAAVGVSSALEKLANKNAFEKKYDVTDKPVLLFAVGDGNHSLATAKTCWEELKKSLTAEERRNHPARFALVEVMNIHDPALDFEPIQRVVFDTEPDKLMAALFKKYPDASYEDNGGQKIEFFYGGKEGAVYVKNAPSNLPVGTLQIFLDEYLSKNSGRIDYIHGSDVAKEFAKSEGNIAFLLEKPEKSDLFKTVITDGALPRKTFSMGEAHDKRFYLEGKAIR